MSPWCVLMCKPRREALAEANLINQGYRVYLPRLATQRRRDGKWVDTLEPLFPRYLFVAAGRVQQGFAAVRSTLGVSDLVRFGGRLAMIPEAVVDALRAREEPGTAACARRSVFQPGSAVRFQGGPFAGLDGIFEMEAGEGRAFILLELLGKLNKVKVGVDWLIPAA